MHHAYYATTVGLSISVTTSNLTPLPKFDATHVAAWRQRVGATSTDIASRHSAPPTR